MKIIQVAHDQVTLSVDDLELGIITQGLNQFSFLTCIEPDEANRAEQMCQELTQVCLRKEVR